MKINFFFLSFFWGSTFLRKLLPTQTWESSTTKNSFDQHGRDESSMTMKGEKKNIENLARFWCMRVHGDSFVGGGRKGGESLSDNKSYFWFVSEFMGSFELVKRNVGWESSFVCQKTKFKGNWRVLHPFKGYRCFQWTILFSLKRKFIANALIALWEPLYS